MRRAATTLTRTAIEMSRRRNPSPIIPLSWFQASRIRDYAANGNGTSRLSLWNSFRKTHVTLFADPHVAALSTVPARFAGKHESA